MLYFVIFACTIPYLIFHQVNCVLSFFEKTVGMKRCGGIVENEASVHKQPFLAPPAAASSSSLKPSSADVWISADKTHIPTSG